VSGRYKQEAVGSRARPALAAVVKGGASRPKGGALLHGLAPTSVVATPVRRQAAEAAEVAMRERSRSPCCSVAQRRLLCFGSARVGPVDVGWLVLQSLSHPVELEPVPAAIRTLNRQIRRLVVSVHSAPECCLRCSGQGSNPARPPELY
jgi:hypothetical protein